MRVLVVFEDKELSKHIHRGFIRIFILKLLSQKERHGYQVLKEARELASLRARLFSKMHDVKSPPVSSGEIYSILSNLEQKGFIVSRQTGGNRPKKVFRITPKGTATLQRGKKTFLLIFTAFKKLFPELLA